MLIVSDISLPFTEPAETAVEKAKQRIGAAVLSARISKRAVDARHKTDIRFVYSVAVSADGDERLLAQKLSHPKIAVKDAAKLDLCPFPCKSRPVVAGFGPAGMFSALVLARLGQRPIVLERGADVATRQRDVERFIKNAELNPESNIQFGEGGAGTFSDGKLATRINDPLCAFVLDELVRHGAPEEILVWAKPHVGTDHLKQIVKNIREEIIALGGEVRFYTRMDDVLLVNGRVCGVKTTAGEISAEALILAPGHSARDTVAMLLQKNAVITAKPFSAGVRIEHLQSAVDEALYGKFAGHPLLPKAEYRHSLRKEGRAAYTFCMCPGGTVVPAASEENAVVVNGMSEFKRNSGIANAALVVSVDHADFGGSPLAGVEFQRELERAAFLAGGGNYRAPAQDAGSFLAGKAALNLGRVSPSYLPGITPADFAAIFPKPITDFLKMGLLAFDRKQPGFAAPDSILTGVETRTSSPVRIERGPDLQALGISGLYPCGEGAGYAGGIMSAAVDGIRTAMACAGLPAKTRGQE